MIYVKRKKILGQAIDDKTNNKDIFIITNLFKERRKKERERDKTKVK